MRAILLCAVTTMVLAGCTANDNSIHRNILIPKGKASAQSVDAKQRFLIAVPVASTVQAESPARNETVKTTEASPRIYGQSPTSVTKEVNFTYAGTRSTTTTSYRYCAEPSPDVFSLYSNSAAADAGVEKGAAAGPLSVLFGFSGSSAEQGSTIARTQTINLLKEVMYRTCERYANGGIGPLELGVQAIRDQRLIIAALAIEQLTGAIVTKPTVIGAAGSANSGADTAAAVVAMDQACNEKLAADAALEKANAKFAEADGKTFLCQPDKRDKEAEKPTEAQTEACEAAAAEVKTAIKADADAIGRVEALKEIAKSGGPVTAAVTTLLAAQGSGGIHTVNTDNMKDVADVVKSIVMANYDASELELLCVKAFDPSQGTPNANVVKACEEYFKALIKQKEAHAARVAADEMLLAAQARSTAVRIDQLTTQLVESRQVNFEIFWALDEGERLSRINAVQKSTKGNFQQLEKLKNPASKEQAAEFFGKLKSTVVEILLKGS